MTTPPSDDSDLRALLHDAVSDVESRGTLHQIHSRSPMAAPAHRRWLLPTLSAAAATVAVIGGVMVLTADTRDDSTPAAQEPVASGETAPTGSPGPEVGADVEAAVPAYFVGDTASGPRLYREFQHEKICVGAECKARAAVRTAVAGRPDDRDYRVPWPEGTSVNDVRWDGDVLSVDLSGPSLRQRPAQMGAEEAELAVQQVLYSAQAGLGQGRPPVRLLLDGKHSDQVLGVPSAEPLAAASTDSVLATIWVTSPTEGASVPTRFEVTGQAATFEANVVWELRQGEELVREGFATAQECCTLSPYSFTVRAEPGDYTLVVRDTDESDGEGVGTSEDTKRITVQ